MTDGDKRFVIERLSSAVTALAKISRELRRLGDDLHHEGQRTLSINDEALSVKAHDRARELELQAGNLSRLRRWLVSREDDDGTDSGAKKSEDTGA